MTFLKSFFTKISSLFKKKSEPIEEKMLSEGATPHKTRLPKIPRFGDKGIEVYLIQDKLIKKGYRIECDSEFGPETKEAIISFQKANGLPGSGIIGPVTLDLLGFDLNEQVKINPAYLEAKKYEGKKETDKGFNKWLSGFWGIVKLPGFKTIVGTSFAWCGLFIAAMNSEVGLSWIENGATAKNWAKYGQAVDWKVNGIPRSAVVHINSKSCNSQSNNHVTFADGDCAPEDLSKPNAVFPGFGGNQNNMVKTSFYSVKSICAVRWPSEMELPNKIDKSVGCKQAATENETQ